MRVVIDRFEGIFAVCEKEDRTIINVNRNKLPQGVKEGDVLKIEEDCISLDKEETERRKANIDELTEDLWN